LGLSLSYNSLVWTESGPYAYFDEENGWPAPGFRLGFSVIQERTFNAQAGADTYLLLTPGGGRVELRESGGVYEAVDGSFLQLDTDPELITALRLRATDGTQTEASYGGCGCAGGETVTLLGENRDSIKSCGSG
jgi:hypothetical protein